MISFLWAQDRNGLIGKEGSLPWRLPADLQYFKQVTMGHPIVMGRKTFESLRKPLPGRTNVILTRDSDYVAPEGCLVFQDKDALKKWMEEEDTEVFVIGGAEIFRLLLSSADRLYVTKIDEVFEGDTYFNELDWNDWRLQSSTPGLTDEKNPYKYEFNIFEKK